MDQALHPDLWDDTYLSIDDARWMAALQGTLGLYEATLQAFLDAYAQGDTHTAATHYGRLNGLIRRIPDGPPTP